MQTSTIRSWTDFDKKVLNKHYRKWIFRGQSDFNWQLESSIWRAFREAKNIHKLKDGSPKTLNKREHEKVMMDRFMCNAHLYLQHLPNKTDELSWLSLMQHHGAPTRLLDFTFSPFIALYFALEHGEGDAAVYCVNHHALKTDDDEYFGKERANVHSRILKGEENKDDSCLYAFEPDFSNQRLLSQQGLFVATNTLSLNHERILSEYEGTERNLLKIKIPARLRYSGIRRLNQMNINSTHIYPGLDGFCMNLRRQPIFGLEWQKRVGKEI